MAIFEKTSNSVIIKYIDTENLSDEYSHEVYQSDVIVEEFCDNNLNNFIKLIENYVLVQGDNYYKFIVTSPINIHFILRNRIYVETSAFSRLPTNSYAVQQQTMNLQINRMTNKVIKFRENLHEARVKYVKSIEKLNSLKN